MTNGTKDERCATYPSFGDGGTRWGNLGPWSRKLVIASASRSRKTSLPGRSEENSDGTNGIAIRSPLGS